MERHVIPDPLSDYNDADEPPARVCTCGARWRWAWHSPLGRYPPRWAAPAVNPCPECQVPGVLDDERGVRDRLRGAGVPEPLWWVTLDDDNVCPQGPTEPPGDHQARARRERKLGIPTVNIPASRTIWKFGRPTEPRWLLVEGPPGVGKSTWLAGIARRLLTRDPDTWEAADRALDLPLPGQRNLVRKGLRDVRYHRVDELVERERVKLRGLDPHPVQDVAHVDTLLLDELGLSDRPSEAERRLVERILCFRNDRGLRTVLATNRTRAELIDANRPLYGARVADRLRGAAHAVLGGPSWRGA